MQRPNYGNPPPAHSPPCTYRHVFVRLSNASHILTPASTSPSSTTRFHSSPATITASPATPFTTPKRLWLRTASRRHATSAGRIWRAPVLRRLHQRPHCPIRLPDGKERSRCRTALHGTERMYPHAIAPCPLMHGRSTDSPPARTIRLRIRTKALLQRHKLLRPHQTPHHPNPMVAPPLVAPTTTRARPLSLRCATIPAPARRCEFARHVYSHHGAGDVHSAFNLHCRSARRFQPRTPGHNGYRCHRRDFARNPHHPNWHLPSRY
ncbi:YIF1-domain-containing protein [Alternaria alternata]|nr:YIF1-domain-containing protein [Alternaria alternata]